MCCAQVGGVVRLVPPDPAAVRRVRVVPDRAARGHAPQRALHRRHAASARTYAPTLHHAVFSLLPIPCWLFELLLDFVKILSSL